ncbi:hypothetical protein BDV96DRAFT_649247 [Lophiotrema nucula]|uniref:Uncharacterized protein n=1 Tax=Lophiotrema nucula TaxID=690887 RepID=A0A6A5Z082_9PLEO|nr:hypothetical protein BDV96DRAFT_649247 [Lophiotrema nucula]
MLPPIYLQARAGKSSNPGSFHDPTTTPPFPRLNAAMSRIQTRVRRPSAALPPPTVLGRLKNATDSIRVSLSNSFHRRKQGFIEEVPMDDLPANVETVLGRAPDFYSSAASKSERTVPQELTPKPLCIAASLWEVLHNNAPYPVVQSEELDDKESFGVALEMVVKTGKTGEQEADEDKKTAETPGNRHDKAVDKNMKTSFQSLDAIVEQALPVAPITIPQVTSRSPPRPVLRRQSRLSQLPHAPSPSERNRAFEHLESQLTLVQTHSSQDDSSSSSSEVSKAADPRTVPPTQEAASPASMGTNGAEAHIRVSAVDLGRSGRREHAVED